MAESVNEVCNRRDRKDKMRGKVDGGKETQNRVKARARQAIVTELGRGRLKKEIITIFYLFTKIL